MRYSRRFLLAILFTVTSYALVHAQTEPPKRLRRPLEVLSLDESATSRVTPAAAESDNGEGGVVADTTLPLVEHDGRVRGGNVADRLRSMRRRAVDVNLSRSFFAEPDAQVVQHHGELPSVARRPAGKVVPKPNTSSEMAETPQPQSLPAAIESPSPTPAPRQVPSPAANSVSIATRPIDGMANDATPVATAPVDTTATTPSTPVATPKPTEEIVSTEMVEVEEPQAPAKTPGIDEDGAVLLTNRAPSITFETMGPRKIIIGQETTYKVRLINNSEVLAKNVVVTVRMPAWAEVNSTSATQGTPLADSANEAMSTVTWELGQVNALGTETLTLGIVPRDSRPIQLAVGWACNPDHATAQIEVQEPMLKMDISGPSDVNFGETATFSITLSNPGTGDARNVVLNLMPSAQQRISGSRDIGTLKMGERKTVDIELTAHQAGRLKVRAMTHADGNLRDEAEKDVVVRRANLQLALLGPPRNYAASGAIYKIRIENTGDAVAEKVRALATLPAGASFVRASDSGSFTAETGQVEWSVGAMQPGTTRVLQIQCELHSSGENRMDVHCQAARELSVAKSVVTHVEALADLKLYVNDPKGAVAVGEQATYEVRIENRGTKAAEMVQVIGYFSDGIEPTSVQGTRGELATGQVIMDPVETIDPRQEVVFYITARANRPGNHVFRAELQCSQPETRLASEEWTKYYNAAGGEIRQAMAPIEIEEDTGLTFPTELQ